MYIRQDIGTTVNDKTYLAKGDIIKTLLSTPFNVFLKIEISNLFTKRIVSEKSIKHQSISNASESTHATRLSFLLLFFFLQLRLPMEHKFSQVCKLYANDGIDQVMI